jgi:pimeloyl-ACP methyl ester carboxylesterase
VDLDTWHAGGARIPIELRSGRHEIFRRIDGAGIPLTLLHGFPTSSWDWAAVVEALRGRVSTLAFDFLGFGASDKPLRHRYTILEQADIVEEMWRACDVRATILVAHDYGVSVTKELLARQREGRLAARLIHVVLSNGILYEAQHRPLWIQRVLASSISGPFLARLVRERDFVRNFARVFSPSHPLDPADAAVHWRAISLRGGARLSHQQLHFLVEGHMHRERWRIALHDTDVSIRYLWGLADPVAGATMLAELRRLKPDADVVTLVDVGHCPHLEVPERVAELLVESAA